MTSSAIDSSHAHAKSAEEFSYLWSGSDDGWVLWRTRESMSQIILNFGLSGPTVSEIILLKNTIHKYKDIASSELLKLLKGNSSIVLDEIATREARVLKEKLKQAGLKFSEQMRHKIRYAFIKNGSTFLMIESDALYLLVAEKAIKMGVPIHEIEC